MAFEPMYSLDYWGEQLHVSRFTILDWIRDRKISSVKVGGQHRLRESDVVKMLKEQPASQEAAK